MRHCLAVACKSFPSPLTMVTVAELSVLGVSWTSISTRRGKRTMGCFTEHQRAFPKDELHPHQVGFEGRLCSKVHHNSEIISAVLILEVKQKHPVDTNTCFHVSIFKREAQLCPWLSIFFPAWLQDFVHKQCTMLEMRVIPKFLLFEYYEFAHLSQPKVF